VLTAILILAAEAILPVLLWRLNFCSVLPRCRVLRG
jgi:hypothetical protein